MALQGLQRNINSEILPRYQAPMASITAGGAGDAVAINGLGVDLQQGVGTRQKAESCSVFVTGLGTVATSQNLTVAVKLQQSNTVGSGYTDITDLPSVSIVAQVGPTTGVAYQIAVGMDLTRVTQRFIRAVVTPDLSASGTDTATVMPVIVLGGFKRN